MTDISEFMTISIYDLSEILGVAVNAVQFVGGNAGCIMGGNYYNTIQYITLNSPGNATDGGDLTLARYASAGCSNGAYDRGLFAGGYSGSFSNVIDYFTVSTASNATDFGDLNYSYDWIGAGSNDTNDRGVFSLGGYGGGAFNGTNHIDYVTISTTGNATNFGNLAVAVVAGTMASNGTNERAVVGGGATINPTYTNTIQYITINTTGNAVDFGDLYAAVAFTGGTSNGTNERGIYGGGQTNGGTAVKKNEISYITINSLGNSTDFGDLTSARHAVSATSNSTSETGVFCGGNTTAAVDTIDYITINSIGNAVDFGDLIRADMGLGACSNGAPRLVPTGDRGVFFLLFNSEAIEYITISTTGNSASFGDLSTAGEYYSISPMANGTGDRGVRGGGTTAPKTTIDYITVSILGNAIDFGDLTVGRHGLTGYSNNTNERGVSAAGYTTLNVNVIDYITINSPGNATDFGDITVNTRRNLAGCSNATNERGVQAGGYLEPPYTTGSTDIIDYVTINSASNATDFGDLGVARRAFNGCSNNTNERGIFGGGSTGSNSNVIDYITINSTGNSTDFGDLTSARYGAGACSNGTSERGVFGGGNNGSDSNIIDYVTINSIGNAADFGDLTTTIRYASGLSNS